MAIPVVDDAAETLREPPALGDFALQQRDLLGILAHPDEVEAEVGLEALLREIEMDQRRADPVRQRRSEHRVDQRAPHEVAGDFEWLAEKMQGSRGRQTPEDHDERGQRHDRTEQADGDTERRLDEHLHVVGDALVRIVGGIALELHPVVIGVVQPFTEVVRGHPAPPADLKPLIEIEIVDAERDVDCCQNGEDAELPDEGVPVLLLERVVEAVVPLVDEDIDRDQRELDHDQGRQQA